MDSFLQDLSSSAQAENLHFTVDGKKLLRGLAKFSDLEEAHYLVRFMQFAYCSEPQKVEVKLNRERVDVVLFEYRHPHGRLRKILDNPGIVNTLQEAHLVAALASASSQGKVTVCDGQGDEITLDSKLEIMQRSSPRNHFQLTLCRRPQEGKLLDRLLGLIFNTGEHVVLSQEVYLRCPLVVDGRTVTPKPQPSGTFLLQSIEFGPGFTAEIGVPSEDSLPKHHLDTWHQSQDVFRTQPNPLPNGIQQITSLRSWPVQGEFDLLSLVRDGVNCAVAEINLGQMGAHIVGSFPELTLDASGLQIVENESFRQLERTLQGQALKDLDYLLLESVHYHSYGIDDIEIPAALYASTTAAITLGTMGLVALGAKLAVVVLGGPVIGATSATAYIIGSKKKKRDLRKPKSSPGRVKRLQQQINKAMRSIETVLGTTLRP